MFNSKHYEIEAKNFGSKKWGNLDADKDGYLEWKEFAPSIYGQASVLYKDFEETPPPGMDAFFIVRFCIFLYIQK